MSRQVHAYLWISISRLERVFICRVASYRSTCTFEDLDDSEIEENSDNYDEFNLDYDAVSQHGVLREWYR